MTIADLTIRLEASFGLYASKQAIAFAIEARRRGKPDAALSFVAAAILLCRTSAPRPPLPQR